MNLKNWTTANILISKLSQNNIGRKLGPRPVPLTDWNISTTPPKITEEEGFPTLLGRWICENTFYVTCDTIINDYHQNN